jgi:hypothetical protein
MLENDFTRAGIGYQEIAHFGAFGFVVLRGLFAESEVARLRSEVTAELRAAFGGVGMAPADGGGIPGDYLPVMVDRAPFAQSLVADDPRLYQGATALTGAATVPTPGVAVCFTGNARWHTEQGPDVGGVKFLVHLDPRGVDSGALRVIPGSHEPGFGHRCSAYLRRDPARQAFSGWPVPAVVLETEPGDVIAFDVHLLHASSGGHRRLAWSIEYLPWPGLGDPERIGAVRDLVEDSADYGQDTERWPAWREWAAGAAANGPASRRIAVERLELLGVLDASGR